MRPVLFGGIGDLFGDAFSAVASLVREVPGASWIEGAIASGATWIGDFAKTDLGYQVVSVVSGGLSPALAPIIGPFAINVAMVAPGIVAGDDFTTAYSKGLADYMAKAAVVFGGPIAGGAGAAVTAAASAGAPIASTEIAEPIKKLMRDARFQEAMDTVGRELKKAGVTPANVLEKLGLSVPKLAEQFNVREDVLAFAADGVLGAPVADLGSFDPLTGKAIQTTAAGIPVGLSAAAYADMLSRARLGGAPQPAIDDLERLWLESKSREKPVQDGPARRIDLDRIRRTTTGLRVAPVTATGELRRVGTVLLLTAPLWGYALYRSPRTLL